VWHSVDSCSVWNACRVVEIEAERLQDHLEEREQFLKDLQEHVERQRKQS